jgi:hypothetical protein
MIQEPKPVMPDVLFYDDDSEEIMNDSLGTFTLADSIDSEMKAEEEEEMKGIGYSSDERQD